MAGGGGSSQTQRGTAEKLAQLLSASSPRDMAAVFARMGSRHAMAVLELLAGMVQGASAVAALLSWLSPVVAAR